MMHNTTGAEVEIQI